MYYIRYWRSAIARSCPMRAARVLLLVRTPNGSRNSSLPRARAPEVNPLCAEASRHTERQSLESRRGYCNSGAPQRRDWVPPVSAARLVAWRQQLHYNSRSEVSSRREWRGVQRSTEVASSRHIRADEKRISTLRTTLQRQRNHSDEWWVMGARHSSRLESNHSHTPALTLSRLLTDVQLVQSSSGPAMSLQRLLTPALSNLRRRDIRRVQDSRGSFASELVNIYHANTYYNEKIESLTELNSRVSCPLHIGHPHQQSVTTIVIFKYAGMRHIYCTPVVIHLKASVFVQFCCSSLMLITKNNNALKQFSWLFV